MAMLAAMRQLLEEKRRLEKETTTSDVWATRPGPGASDLAPGLEAAVAAAQKFAAEARTPLLRARRKCWYDAEIQKPVILRDLLSSDDVAKLRRMRAARWGILFAFVIRFESPSNRRRFFVVAHGWPWCCRHRRRCTSLWGRMLVKWLWLVVVVVVCTSRSGSEDA